MGKRGPKPGSGGRPKTPLVDKITNDNPGKRPLMVLDGKMDRKNQDLKPPSYLREKGVIIFNQTIDWLKPTGCLGYINPEHIAEYALCKQRWVECEEWNDKNLLAKHPTTGQPMQSPYVEMGLKYLRQADTAWTKIYDVVKENATVEFRADNPNNDVMEELLLRGKKSRSRG